jgi:hypothetical protein
MLNPSFDAAIHIIILTMAPLYFTMVKTNLVL